MADAPKKDPDPIERQIWLLPGVGLAAIVIYAAARSSWTMLGIAFMVGAAAFLAGSLVGFLFGIPRTLTAERGAATLPDEGGGSIEYQPNTNLEQISDWLTKILVGVGLVQLGQIRHGFSDLVDSVAPSLGDDSTAHAFAGALLVYYVVAGFLAGYLVTRLRLAGAFAYADRATLGKFVEKVARRTVDEQATKDARVLALLTQQLEAGDVDPKELEAAVKDASRQAKVQVYLQARGARQQSWKDDKPALERTIPVFEALGAADTKQEYHRHFGELGFALKDKAEPDWAAAKEALSTAIEVRDKKKARGHRIYEFNRALCEIHLDPDFGSGGASSDELKERILSDLKASAKGVHSNRVLREDAEVAAWLQANGLNLNDFSDEPDS
jgi:hypothetical protein